MFEPLVSVVIPTYKRADKLRGAINSVLGQTYRRWELIIVDDNDVSGNSRIDAANIIKSYEDSAWIIYIKHETHRGACIARNTGIINANGEYIAFLDDDDTWFKNKLEMQMNLIRQNRNLGFVYCNVVYKDGIEGTTSFTMRNNMFYDLLKRGAGICTSALVIKKDILLAINGFDETLPSYQDYDLLLRLSLKAECDYVEEPLLMYRVEADGISRDSEAKLRGKEIILEKYKNYFKGRDMQRNYGEHLHLLGNYAISSGKRVKAIRYYIDSIMNNPLLLKSYIKIIIIVVGGRWFYRLLLSHYVKIKVMRKNILGMSGCGIVIWSQLISVCF